MYVKTCYNFKLIDHMQVKLTFFDVKYSTKDIVLKVVFKIAHEKKSCFHRLKNIVADNYKL